MNWEETEMRMKKAICHGFVCLLLAVILIAGIVVPSSAATMTADDLKLQVRQTYLEAKEWSKLDSFSYLCGSFVAHQLYVLGINKAVSDGQCNGCNQFEKYCNRSTSSGGYQITAYDSDDYTLESVLNKLSSNGKKDVFNILVGFDRFTSSSEEGKENEKYGHVVFIHGIVGGKVYYVECFSVGGNKSGTVLEASLSTFCSRYTPSRWTFDGVINFTLDGKPTPVENYDDGVYIRKSNTPADMAKGDSFDIKGMVYSRKNELQSVTAAVYDSTGKAVLKKTVSLERKFFNLSRISSNLDFSTLPKGTYTYAVTANNGKTIRDVKAVDFNVGAVSTAEDTVTLDNGAAPTVLAIGQDYAPTGILNSTVTNIISMSLKLYNASGAKIAEISAYPRAKTYDVSNLNVGDMFTSLTPGVYTYRIAAKNAVGTQVPLLKEFTVMNKPTVTNPADQSIAEGQTATFSVTATDAESYRWYYSADNCLTWTAVTAASGKTATYSLTAAARHNGYRYRCVVTNKAGSVSSGVASLTVNCKPVITTQPTNKTVDVGSTAQFKVVATGATSYQWYYRTSSTGSWTAVSASSGKTSTYSLTAQERHNGYQYRCKVTNGIGSVYTDTVTLTVNGKPVITTQPMNKTVTAGSKATFKVVATGATSYQWYYRTSSTGSWTAVSAASGKTSTYSLTVAARHNGYQYRCLMKNAAGSVYSNVVTLTVNSGPVITTQPTSKTVTAGNKATFKVVATGAESYQWYYRTSSSGSWTAVSAASGKTATYSLTAAARHSGYQYRCEVKNAVGAVYTSIVTLTVE